MKRIALIALFLGGSAAGQVPDVRFRGDVTAAVVTRPRGANTVRLYSPLGRYSTVGLSVFFENGLIATVTQRLQGFSGDPDDEPLDEYLIEDPGLYRIGKQYLPFGSGLLLRESVRAARVDTNLILEGVPITLAVFDGGPRRPSGVMARIGPRAYGFSLEVGQAIGVSGSALSIVRSPEGDAGSRRGWRRAVGIDAAYRVGTTLYRAEVLALSNDARGGERDRILFDLALTRDLRRRDSVTAELILDAERRESYLRFSASLGNGRGVFLEPLLIVRGANVDRAGVAIRYRF